MTDVRPGLPAYLRPNASMTARQSSRPTRRGRPVAPRELVNDFHGDAAGTGRRILQRVLGTWSRPDETNG